jgi:glycosyl-4,4'-diaponeurosporenoate acyltransferase
MTMSELVLRIVIDIFIVVTLSVIIGATAPRWPANWLSRDRGLLRLTTLDTPRGYRRIGIHRFKDKLPELGAIFGGQSKGQLPGSELEQLALYARELRRAEWVHWLSMLTWIPLAFFNPWWLTAAFAIAVIVGNAPFVLIVRYNRMRVLRIAGHGE